MAKKTTKRNKKYNPHAQTQRFNRVANQFVIWAIDGVGSGVKRMPYGNETKVTREEYPALTIAEHKFRTIAGVCWRTPDGVPHIKYVEFDTIGHYQGDRLSKLITDMAKQEADEIHRPDFLTIFYFTSPNVEIEYTDELVARWIAEAGTWDKLVTWRENLQNEAIRMSEHLDKINLDETQVGGSHYSKLEVQPRHVIVGMQLPWDFGNAIKYVIRYKDKNGSQDLRKAWDYIARMRQSGREAFPQRRVLNRHKELWNKFVAQFDLPVQQVLGIMWEAYTDKIKDDEHFNRAMGAILYEINALHKIEYNQEDAF